MSPTNLRARKVNERLATEDRIRLLMEELERLAQCDSPQDEFPDVQTIALITGARSETVVKSVLWELSQG